ncbi:MAG: hypothetical protein WB791_07290 [Waddliaceae bacterium]
MSINPKYPDFWPFKFPFQNHPLKLKGNGIQDLPDFRDEADAAIHRLKNGIAPGLNNLFNCVRGSNSHKFLKELRKLKDCSLVNNPFSLFFPQNGQLAVITKISFNQKEDLIDHLNDDVHKTLLAFDKRYNGLCELICNVVLKSNLLGKGNHPLFLKGKINVQAVNEDSIKQSHILKVYSVFHRVIAFLFGIYPDNIFSLFDQWRLIRNKGNQEVEVNRELLGNGLKNIKEGETLKLEIVWKQGLRFEGHSLLVKKISEKAYTVFDPNSGEERELSLDDLADKINTRLKEYGGTDIFFIRGEDFLRRLQPAV